MRIGLDIDGVLAAFSEHFLDYLGFQDQSEATSWYDTRFRQNMHMVEKDVDFWLGIPPLVLPGELLFTPAIYVTARPIPNYISQTWLHKNGFPNPEKTITVRRGQLKSEVLEDRVDLFVDDAYHNFVDLNKNGILCYLRTRSHNVNYDAGHLRINNLNDLK